MTIQTTTTTQHPLIPAGAQMSSVEHIEFDVRTIFDYSVDYMTDRMMVTVHTGGDRRPESYSVLSGFEWESAAQIRLHEQPAMRARVIDSALGLGYEGEIQRLLKIMLEMQANIDALSRPLWRKAYDRVGSWISGVR